VTYLIFASGAAVNKCRKNGLIKQFLKDVNWGELDYLIVDAPPGTSDEHITIAQCLQASSPADGALIVSTPQVINLKWEVCLARLCMSVRPCLTCMPCMPRMQIWS